MRTLSVTAGEVTLHKRSWPEGGPASDKNHGTLARPLA